MTETKPPVIGVVGAGAWGTALACLSARAGQETLLWCLETDLAPTINETRQNAAFLPDVPIPDGVRATALLADLQPATHLLMVTPAQHVRTSLGNLSIALQRRRPLLLCSKGLERPEAKLMSEVAGEVVPGWPLAVLSGPNFAGEVARGLPAAATIACADQALGEAWMNLLSHAAFRPYLSDDLIGAQIGGAVKNVLAIACGVAHGLKLGDNARAGLITRGMAEMVRFALAKGARRETLMGLSGLGDLILTCSSLTSRNMSFGAALGEGRSAQEILAEQRSVAEGAYTVHALVAQARALGVDMPICEGVQALVDGRVAAHHLMDDLMTRPLKTED
ncbi:MAG: NAD(P)H-dependent glycerol-3-phosphate dehydrogenase [Rhodothalassiaceae bacterium]